MISCNTDHQLQYLGMCVRERTHLYILSVFHDGYRRSSVSKKAQKWDTFYVQLQIYVSTM